ncbi:hemerythrin domain-containing protein [Phytoactinopolyspora endophytica]|uniref:hemerythrin domain-containing protein n=1 Tax=Phytoactinopolyspora endophytica TaxID=1642495 RepID=UPI00101D4672|nr:hemerythrin domain-containing protein [Phytoactinopolyspora endophytica]
MSDAPSTAATPDGSEAPQSVPGADRITAFGDFLVQIHGWLREELETVRHEVDEFVAGHGAPPETGRTPPTLTLELRKHCLQFCEGLHHHHSGEDSLLFPALREDFPELAPTIARLQEQHVTIGKLLEEFESVLSEVDSTEPARVQSELARLSSELEAHLDNEESQLVEAMNSMPQERVDALIAASAADDES